MLRDWLQYLKRGLSCGAPRDSLAGERGYQGLLSCLRQLWPFISGHWKKMAIGAVLFLAASLISFPQPLIMRYLIDHVILGRHIHLLAGTALFLVAIYAAARLLGLVQPFYFQRLEQAITIDIQKDLYDRVLRLPMSFFDDKETGYLMSRLSSDVAGVRWFFSGALLTILYNGIRFAGGIGFLLYLEWRLAMVLLVALPATVFLVSFFSRKIHTLAHRSMEQQAVISSRLQEMLSSVPLIKAFSSEDRTSSRLMSEVSSGMRLSLEQSAVRGIAGISMSIPPDIARGIVLLAGAYWIINGDWTMGSLFAFQAYLGYLFGPLQFFASSSFGFQSSLAALERVSALRDVAPEDNVGIGQIVEHLTGDVEFRNVSFSYNGRDKVLKEISFVAGPGERIGVVGPSGVGKTTLLNLLLCFYKPTGGRILYDGRPSLEYEVRSLRGRIGFVSQRTLLCRGLSWRTSVTETRAQARRMSSGQPGRPA